MVDTGVSSNVLTPGTCEQLGITPKYAGIRTFATKGFMDVRSASLQHVAIAGQIPVPNFTASVFDMPQAALAAQQNTVLHGVVGMEFLEQFDVKWGQVPPGTTLPLHQHRVF